MVVGRHTQAGNSSADVRYALDLLAVAERRVLEMLEGVRHVENELAAGMGM